MRKLLAHFCPLLLLLFATASWAATINPCPAANLSGSMVGGSAVYLDAAGYQCTVGTSPALTFENFSYTSASVPANDVAVVPISNSTDTGLEFSGPFGANPGDFLNVSIGFTILAPTAIINGETLSMLGFGATGSGAVQVDETVCIGGTFSGGVCSSGASNIRTLQVFDNGSGLQQTQSISFAAATEISVLKDVIVLGGNAGTCNTSACNAGVSEVINTVPVGGGGGTTGGGSTPEPDSMLLLGSGLVATSLLVRRRSRRV